MAYPEKRVTRAPRGVMSHEPVYMRLMPAEREELVRLAGLKNSSLSSVARNIFNEGIAGYRDKLMSELAQRHANALAER